MKSAAIIAEFNPFHNGHKYLIDAIKKEYGVDFVVVFMSGDFVQRGEPAIFDKYTRTECALKGGADVIFELPAVYASSAAPDFAYGGVALANALNCFDCLAFGSESGDIDELKKAALLLQNEPDDFKALVKASQKEGKSYALAVSDALFAYTGSTLLKTPNNTLAIEYIKVLSSIGSNIKPVTIKRYGVEHNSMLSATDETTGLIYESASKIRASIKENTAEPHNTPMFFEDFALPLFSKLRTMGLEDLSAVLSCDKDTASRILSCSVKSNSLEELIDNVSHKQITRASVSRVLSHILLDMDESSKAEPLYARLLGMKRSASPFMKAAQKSSLISIVTKAADFGIYDNGLFMKDLYSSDLYSRAFSLKYKTEFVPDVKRSPIIL